ncbi:hypothetical protein RQP46_001471 [Phenoliferia psychrophenolica]
MTIVPPEIIEAIVSQVPVEDLPACALASKLLLPFARENLYRSIRIKFYDMGTRDPGQIIDPYDRRVGPQHAQVLLLAALQRNPNLGSLVREIACVNLSASPVNFGVAEHARDLLLACPNVDRITHSGGIASYQANDMVRAVLAVKPKLRRFTMLCPTPPLIQQFLAAYPDIKSLGILSTRLLNDETYLPAASIPAALWPASLATLKFDANHQLSQTVFDTVTSNSSHAITSLSLSFTHPLPRDPLDLSALSALSTLTLKGVQSSDLMLPLSTCKNLQQLFVQITGWAFSLEQLMSAVHSTIHLLGLRSQSRIPREVITAHVKSGLSPLLREIWLSLAQNEDVDGEALVAACVAKGVVMRHQDWGGGNWSGR